MAVRSLSTTIRDSDGTTLARYRLTAQMVDTKGDPLGGNWLPAGDAILGYAESEWTTNNGQVSLNLTPNVDMRLASGWLISVQRRDADDREPKTLYSAQVALPDSDSTVGDLIPQADTGAAPVQGPQGPKGDPGLSTVVIFNRASTAPATPAGGSVSGTTLTPPTGWTLAVPAGSDRLYASVVRISGTTPTYSSVIPFEGPTGPQGPRGNQGNKGDDGDDGAPGAAGASAEIQYSIDGSTLWHSTYTSGDLFIRFRVGTGAWSSAARFVGLQGVKGDKGDDGDPGATGPPGADGTNTVVVQDEGTALATAATTLDFVGAGVEATGTGATKTITIAGGGGGGTALTVKNDNTALTTAATTLDFGDGIDASGTTAEKEIKLALAVKDEGTLLAGGAAALNFRGPGISISGTGDEKTINVQGTQWTDLFDQTGLFNNSSNLEVKEIDLASDRDWSTFYELLLTYVATPGVEGRRQVGTSTILVEDFNLLGNGPASGTTSFTNGLQNYDGWTHAPSAQATGGGGTIPWEGGIKVTRVPSDNTKLWVMKYHGDWGGTNSRLIIRAR